MNLKKLKMAIKMFKKIKDQINKLKKIFIDLESISELKRDLEDLKKSKNILLDRDIAIIRSAIAIDQREFELKAEQFDFIKNIHVRRQLIVDHIKMMATPRYDFDILCQYSFFQIEQLINYYYNLRFEGASNNKLAEYFLSYYDDDKLKEAKKKNQNVGKISARDKLNAFWKEFEFKNPLRLESLKKSTLSYKTLKFDIFYIQYVRNTVHRDAYFTNQVETSYYSKNKENFQKIINKDNNERSSGEWHIFNRMNRIKFRKAKKINKVINRTNNFVRVIRIEIEKQQQKN
ncbi:MAG: hypothetical protein CMC04_07040 [Flavobacteriaceae bacterium]|nr:hypothetical protein [Flavobacteriaceae bacterium]